MRRLVGGLFIACLGYGADMQRFVSDPLYVNQWHLAPYGIHINIGNTWDFVTGRGINIEIVDDGLDLTHEDLAPNVYPMAVKSAGTHGTQCAGLAAAAGFNDIGMIGVAPEARLMGWSEGLLPHVAIHCSGRLDDGKDPGRIGPLQQAEMEKAATNNRDGLGRVAIIPAGDGRALGDDSAYDAIASSRFAIAIAAVNREGQQSSYSEGGMNVAISAPGGEALSPASLWTTGAGGLYTEEFYGTSAAAAIAGGAVALLLERNPALGYRDVKEILMRSATREPLSAGDPFEQNGGGITFSHSFGAGLVDVTAAIALADDWIPLGPVVTVQTSNHAAMTIQDDPLNPLHRYLDLYGGQPVRVEHVELTLTVRHARRGDLSFTIVSPSGMKSVAAGRPNDDGADFESYTFTSVRHWGEISTGMWKVIVTDHNGNGISGEMLDIQLRLFGTIPRS